MKGAATKGYIHGAFVIARRDILDDPEVPGAARMVYVALASYSTRTGRNVKVSREQIAERSGFSLATVKRALDTLGKLGYIERSPGGRRKGTWSMCTYDLTYAADKRRAPAAAAADSFTAAVPERERTPETAAALTVLVGKFGSQNHA